MNILINIGLIIFGRADFLDAQINPFVLLDSSELINYIIINYYY